MKFAMVTAAVCAAALAAGCTGGGGGGGLAPADGRITTGNYAFTVVNITDDGCALDAQGLAPAPGDAVTITVNGANITVDSGSLFFTDDGTINGTYEQGVIDIDETGQFDWNPSGLGDCVEDDRYRFEGRSETDTTVIDGTLREDFTVASGPDCDAVYTEISNQIGTDVSLPCDSTVEFELGKFITVTGTLTTAYGMTAIGVTPDAGSATTGTDLRINFTLGTGAPVNLSNESYDCWAPDPPTYPNYEITASDFTTYSITIGVPPPMWTAGVKTVTSSGGVIVRLATVDGGAASTGGGTLNLITAPTSTTGACSFAIGAVPIAGEVAPTSMQSSAATAYLPFVPTLERPNRKRVGQH